MLIKKLKDIANISTGYTFRSKIEPNDDGNYFVIQSRDLTDSFVLSDEGLIKTLVKSVSQASLVKNDDIILSSRGKYKAAILTVNQPTVASSSVFLIRIKDKKEILPEYLGIYLNSYQAQLQLEKLTTNSYIKSLPKSNLKELKIKIPDLRKQEQIISLYQNISQQKELLGQKIDLLSSISQNSFLYI